VRLTAGLICCAQECKDSLAPLKSVLNTVRSSLRRDPIVVVSHLDTVAKVHHEEKLRNVASVLGVDRKHIFPSAVYLDRKQRDFAVDVAALRVLSTAVAYATAFAQGNCPTLQQEAAIAAAHSARVWAARGQLALPVCVALLAVAAGTFAVLRRHPGGPVAAAHTPAGPAADPAAGAAAGPAGLAGPIAAAAAAPAELQPGVGAAAPAAPSPAAPGGPAAAVALGRSVAEQAVAVPGPAASASAASAMLADSAASLPSATSTASALAAVAASREQAQQVSERAPAADTGPGDSKHSAKDTQAQQQPSAASHSPAAPAQVPATGLLAPPPASLVLKGAAAGAGAGAGAGAAASSGLAAEQQSLAASGDETSWVSVPLPAGSVA
jgi:hypothetical protein